MWLSSAALYYFMVERWKCICPPLYKVYHERVTCAMNALHAVITVRRSLTATSFALRTSSISQRLRLNMTSVVAIVTEQSRVIIGK